MTAGFTNGITFKMSDEASPEVYTAIEEVKSIGGLGKTNPLIDTTSFDSTAKEYIASSLAEGSEISIECIRVHTAANKQDALVTNVNNASTVSFQLIVADAAVSPGVKTYSFDAVCVSWTITPSYEDANMISFALKISGDITIS